MIIYLEENADGYIEGATNFPTAGYKRIKWNGIFPDELMDEYGRHNVRWTGTGFVKDTLSVSEEEQFNADNIKKTILALSLIVESIVREEPLPTKAVEYMQKAITYIKETL